MTSELLKLANKLSEKYAGGEKEWKEHLAKKKAGKSITLTDKTSQAELTAWANANPRMAQELRRMLNEILGAPVPQNYGDLTNDRKIS